MATACWNRPVLELQSSQHDLGPTGVRAAIPVLAGEGAKLAVRWDAAMLQPVGARKGGRWPPTRRTAPTEVEQITEEREGCVDFN